MAIIQSLSMLYLTFFMVLIILFYGKKIHKHENTLYLVTLVISIVLSGFSVLSLMNEMTLQEGLLYDWFFRGHISFAMYIPLMFAGVLKKKSRLKIAFMQVRRELAIVGALLLLPHVVLLIGVALAALNPTGTIAFFMIIPLVITSFPKIRRRFSREQWLGFHKWAYLVYGMIYLHLFSINLIAQRGSQEHYDQLWWLRLMIYTLIFGYYLYLRFISQKIHKKTSLA